MKIEYLQHEFFPLTKVIFQFSLSLLSLHVINKMLKIFTAKMGLLVGRSDGSAHERPVSSPGTKIRSSVLQAIYSEMVLE